MKKGAVARPFQMLRRDASYLIALSVIAVVKPPSAGLEMIFWSSKACAVRS